MHVIYTYYDCTYDKYINKIIYIHMLGCSNQNKMYIIFLKNKHAIVYIYIYINPLTSHVVKHPISVSEIMILFGWISSLLVNPYIFWFNPNLSLFSSLLKYCKILCLVAQIPFNHSFSWSNPIESPCFSMNSSFCVSRVAAHCHVSRRFSSFLVVSRRFSFRRVTIASSRSLTTSHVGEHA